MGQVRCGIFVDVAERRRQAVAAMLAGSPVQRPQGVLSGRSGCLPPGRRSQLHCRAAIDQTKKLTGCEIERAYVDKEYRGHDARNPRRVFISGQKRGVFGAIKRELRRRSAIEPLIGHLKAEGHLGRCYLKGRAGDAANAVLTAVGYNLRRILAWLRIPWCQILQALSNLFAIPAALNPP
jgi:IS5 family transposase